MIVLCIDAKDRQDEEPRKKGEWEIIEGEKYTVIDCFLFNNRIVCYNLEEDPESDIYGYDWDRFVEVSQIDETEMQRNYNHDKAKV